MSADWDSTTDHLFRAVFHSWGQWSSMREVILGNQAATAAGPAKWRLVLSFRRGLDPRVLEP